MAVLVENLTQLHIKLSEPLKTTENEKKTLGFTKKTCERDWYQQMYGQWDTE